MEHVNILRDYGLFDARVPRYTSYPPANRFLPTVGAENQQNWLKSLPVDEPVSIYVHIPFCRRLCWFCACRTQGTKTLSPVESYVDDLIKEVETVGSKVPAGLRMSRLHLGGGTPTLLSAAMMDRMLRSIFEVFSPSGMFEFSVEIDPTEASPEVLDVLSQWGMKRASIGVQDFNPRVQEAIGRVQSFEDTSDVVNKLRANGVASLNVDLLYGLPHQEVETLVDTLDRVVSLRPDRIALYGYAHVPHFSKRQVMIPSEDLPSAERRFVNSEIAKQRLLAIGYKALGIDHFALADDSLAIANRQGKMRRNFQGYTDDPCQTLLGIGASAISKFKQGYLQNSVATATYRSRVRETGLAAQKGHVMDGDDLFIKDLIDSIMCAGCIETAKILQQHPDRTDQLSAHLKALRSSFPKAVNFDGTNLSLRTNMIALTRIIAAHLDKEITEHHVHSIAI